VAGKTVDRSILQGESIELFRAAIKSPATRDPYERRLIHFLKIMELAKLTCLCSYAFSRYHHMTIF
jgi:hypothetical protein